VYDHAGAAWSWTCAAGANPVVSAVAALANGAPKTPTAIAAEMETASLRASLDIASLLLSTLTNGGTQQ
jgi:hypothetical protein